ncbi:unnamed protein product [Camellia sinensis]
MLHLMFWQVIMLEVVDLGGFYWKFCIVLFSLIFRIKMSLVDESYIECMRQIEYHTDPVIAAGLTEVLGTLEIHKKSKQ